MTDHGDPALLAAKLMPPELRAPSLRADQLERVAAAAKARLLLVRAPAGYGKTTLVTAAAAELGWRCVWYRLDLLDADPHCFLAALRSALAAALPHSAALRTPAAPAAQQDALQAAARLAADLGRAAPGDLCLVLDDYEALADAAAFNEALAALLSYLPAAVHVVLLSRVRPAFATTKLALDGGLAEITHSDLRFDGAQVAEVIERHAGTPAAPVAVEALLGLTEGWPAGVLLAAKASPWRDSVLLDEMLRGGDLERAAYPYLAEQVYARQSPESQGFLRQSWCLDSLSAALAEAVTGMPDAGRVLAQLEAEGAFTFSGPSGGAYHYHPLLRSFLREQLAAEGGRAAVTELRKRSARALAEEGLPADAVALYLEAGDPGATLEVLRKQGYQLLAACPQPLLSRWIAGLGGEGARHAGWAALLQGHQLFVAGDLSGARRRLEAGLAAMEEDRSGRYLTLRALADCCSLAGADDVAIAYAENALEACEDRDRAECLYALGWALEIACRWRELDEVLAAFEHCAPVPAELSANVSMMAVHRAYSAGDARAALIKSEVAMPTIRRDASSRMAVSLLTALANFNLFACHYARGARFLEEARRETGACGSMHARAQVEVTQAAFAAQQGHLHECLGLLEDLIEEPLMQTSAGVLCNVHLMAATALRRAGEPARAMQSCRRALASLLNESTVYDRLDAQVDLAFAEGLCGAHRHAVARLRPLREEAEASGVAFQAAKAGFFLGVLLLRSGEDGAADLIQSGTELLRLGHLDFLGQELVANPEASAWLRAEDVADEELRELLRVTALQVGGPPVVASLAGSGDRILTLLLSLARTDIPERQAALLLQALRRHSSKEVRDRARRLDLGTDASMTRLFLELTPREEEILALLAEGCSNQQVARRLVLSVGTVKSHVHRILAKTGSSGRLAAAMLYRQRAEASRDVAANTSAGD